MRGLEDAPLALGLSRTIMVAGVCVGASGVAHPFHALCRQQRAVETQCERLGWLGGCVHGRVDSRFQGCCLPCK